MIDCFWNLLQTKITIIAYTLKENPWIEGNFMLILFYSNMKISALISTVSSKYTKIPQSHAQIT